MARRYELKRRAERQAETRRRITEATVELHRTRGPAQTTISEIAARAGVRRPTVYNHFPDETALLRACSGHWNSLHPRPDPARWGEVEDPEDRLRAALGDVYAYWAETEDMTEKVLRDAAAMPALGALVQGGAADWDAAVDALARGRPRRKAVRATLAFALDFHTWRTLVRAGGLSRRQAVELMVEAARAAERI